MIPETRLVEQPPAQRMSRPSYPEGLEILVRSIQQLSLARDLTEITSIVRRTARALTGADGATFILKEGEFCYYVDESAISPLWKGRRFPLQSCVSGWVMKHRASCLIEDIAQDDRVPRDVYRETFARSMLMVPIRTLDPIGAIGNYWAETHRPAANDVRLLQALADATAATLERIRIDQHLEELVRIRTDKLRRTNERLREEIAERRRAEEEIRRLSLVDSLTGLANRRGFLQRADQELRRLKREGGAALLFFADVDGLKVINDTFGHLEGDQLLWDYASILRSVFRESDIVARLGGDEFAVFALDDNAAAIRWRLEQRTAWFNEHSRRRYQVSASIGFVGINGELSRAADIEELLARADREMYAAKRSRSNDRAAAQRME